MAPRRTTLGSKRGSAMVEFALAGVAAVLLLISTFQLGMAMWNYHTLAMAVHDTTRWMAVKGVGCTQPGNSCSVTVGNIAQHLTSLGIGLPASAVIVTLRTNSGAETTCNPLSSCSANSTVWPPASNNDNALGSYITLSAKYNFQSAMLFWWPGQTGQNYGSFWLPASSQQKIVF